MNSSLKIYRDGTKEWRLNGKLHRTHGPAVKDNNGSKFWYINGKLHRTNGPAILHPDGKNFWYVNGEKINKEDIEAWLREYDVAWPFNKEVEMLFKLKFM